MQVYIISKFCIKCIITHIFLSAIEIFRHKKVVRIRFANANCLFITTQYLQFFTIPCSYDNSTTLAPF
ncbi:hypothetical protein C1646_723453 [Rhizophagus diaphanus]|nr:hypothetical protein C1646_723453 [Rhizophagus diaphanus] [Rhizophagus sp. MUCL 43196]